MTLLAVWEAADTAARDLPGASKYWTPLMEAAALGDAVAVAAQLRPRQDLNLRDADGQTALALSADNGHVVVTRMLLMAGAAPNSANNNGETPLYLASRRGFGAIVRALVESGGRDQPTFRGVTALDAAAGGCYEGIVKTLLDAGTAIGPGAESAALIAAAGTCDGDMIEMLASRGAGVDARDKGGRTALWYAADKGNVRAVRRLLALNATNVQPDNSGDTPLARALIRAHWEAAVALLTREEALGGRNGVRNTPLMLAAGAGGEAVAKQLIALGADVDARNAFGYSALMLAAERGHEKVVDALLASGADSSLRNVRREQARDLALQAGKPAIASRLSNF